MDPIVLIILDLLLYIAHLLLVGFNLVGWIWRSTRKWHLLCVALTTLSWFVLGIWYGFGYCFLTDWQWNIKHMRGKSGLPNSFIDHFANQVLGLPIETSWIDYLTGIIYFIVAILTVILNMKDRRFKRGK